MICMLDADPKIVGEAAVKMANVRTRSFKPDAAAWERFPNRVIAMDAAMKERYINRIEAESKRQREYYSIGNAYCDNMATVERMGLGVYSKKYMYTLDFSGCFNLILSKMTGVDLGYLNSVLPDSTHNEFYRVLKLQSKADFSKVMQLTPECIEYFAGLVQEEHGGVEDMVLKQVLEMLQRVMGYVFIDCQKQLQEECGVGIILRSYTFCELIVTTDTLLEGTIDVLYRNGSTAVKVKLQPEEIVVL